MEDQMGADLAYITPKVVTWARKRAGIQPADIAAKLKLPQNAVSDWEAGNSLPTFGVAIKLAELLHIPFGFLFMADAPEAELSIPDLRTVRGASRARMSVDFMDILSGCLLRQQWYSEYLQASGRHRLRFPGSMTISDGVQAVANAIGKTLGIHDGWREESDNWEQFKTRLVEAAEQAGIIVMQSGVGSSTSRPLSVAEFRGFAVVDEFAPLVFINTKDAVTARVFTLMHEIAHIWIGESGISNPKPREQSIDETSKIEVFCNKVAAEVLVPKLGLFKRWNDGVSLAENIARIARYYRVSRYVALRQALEQNLVSKQSYLEFLDANPSLWKPADASSGGGSFYPTFYTRNSKRVVRGAISALEEAKITYREACNLFGVKVGTIKKVAERLGE